MAWEDFCNEFTAIGLCDRSVNINTECNLRIEGEGTCCGPIVGCITGLGYLCC